MIHPDEAVAIISRFRREPEVETVGLRQAVGRIMPFPCTGSIDQPPFDKSAMDGWVWKPVEGETIPSGPLCIRGVIAAGSGSISGDRPDDPLCAG